MKDFTAKIIAELDTTKIPGQIKKISSDYSINLGVKNGSKYISEVSKAEKTTNSFNNSLKAATLGNRMELWLKKNSKASKDFGSQILNLKNRLDNLHSSGNLTTDNLKGIETEFKMIEKSAMAAGKTGKTFSDTFKGAFKSLSNYIGVSTILYEIIDGLKQMYSNAKNVDTAMTNLYKVTDETDKRYQRFTKDAANSAKDLGRTISSYITQTADWSKLGYNLDDAEKLSKLSSIYSNVGEIDDSTAVSDMVTAMKAFDIVPEKAQMIIDSLNELGNTFAVTTGGLGEGLAKSAASMETAGVSFHETIAMIAGGSEITQDSGGFGNFLKVASMRIRGMKGELESLGEEINEEYDSISKVQTQILNLTSGIDGFAPIDIFDDNGEFRNYFEIMKEISEIFDKMSSQNQAKLTEILFGKLRANQGSALIKSFQSGQIEKALETSLGSDGSAIREQEKWLESIDAKTAQFKATWEDLSITLLDNSFLKGIIDDGSGVLKLLDNLAEKGRLLPAIFITATAALSLKNVGELINQF